MNTLRISKGKDIELCVNNDVLCFVTDFVAKERTQVYEIEEFMSEDMVDEVELRKRYELIITAYTHFNEALLQNDNFVLTVKDSENLYEYSGCRLVEKIRDIKSSKAVVDKYIIEASHLNISEVAYE